VLRAAQEEPSVAAEVAPEPIAEPEPEPKPVRKPEPVQPAAIPASDLPWWLSAAPHLSTPQRPAVIWEAAKVETSRMGSTVGESVTAAPGPVQQQAAPVAAVQPREQAPGPVPAPAGEAVPAAVQTSTLEEPQENLTSRLSGLRSLLFVLGVKESHSGEEQAERSTLDRPSAERTISERPSFERTISQTPAGPTASSAQGASLRLVTAPPEFLPPKPIVIEFEELDEPKGESSTRQDRRASFDGIETLPSKRGQYKKI
jgi:hypothetical protein